MNEEPTQNMPAARSFEERVFDELRAINAQLTSLNTRLTALDTRLTALEEKVDRRLQETRPIWEADQTQLKHLNTKLDIVITDLYDMRTNITALDRRVTTLEDTRPQ